MENRSSSSHAPLTSPVGPDLIDQTVGLDGFGRAEHLDDLVTGDTSLNERRYRHFPTKLQVYLCPIADGIDLADRASRFPLEGDSLRLFS